eukprot:COSAG02_NODE_366_length_23740_cov_20.235904_17_plen_77_part_00
MVGRIASERIDPPEAIWSRGGGEGGWGEQLVRFERAAVAKQRGVASYPPLPVDIGIGERVETLRPRKFRAPAVPGR